MRPRQAVAGLLLAGSLLAMLVYGVGWRDVLDSLREADSILLSGAFVAGAATLALRGLVVARLLAPVSDSARGVGFASAFLSGYFARSVLPWGRSVGTPITAYLLARNSDSAFEDNLAVVAVAEVFAFVASLVVALVGLAAVTATGEIPGESLSRVLRAGAAALAATVVLLVVSGRGWPRRLSSGLGTRWESVAVRVPRLPDYGALERRLERLVRTFEAVAAEPRTLAVAFAIALASWIVNGLPLYLSLHAIGVDAPLALALACAPLAAFAGVVPLPGGTGGVEVALAGLLVTTTGASLGAATAAALLYRLSTYWTHLVLGGGGAVYLSLAGTAVFAVD